MKSTCSRSPGAPSRRLTSAMVVMEVGQTSGHCVKPKKTTTILPLKSAIVLRVPWWSLSLRSFAKAAPVTSVLLKELTLGEQATSAGPPAAQASANCTKRRRSVHGVAEPDEECLLMSLPGFGHFFGHQCFQLLIAKRRQPTTIDEKRRRLGHFQSSQILDVLIQNRFDGW